MKTLLSLLTIVLMVLSVPLPMSMLLKDPFTIFYMVSHKLYCIIYLSFSACYTDMFKLYYYNFEINAGWFSIETCNWFSLWFWKQRHPWKWNLTAFKLYHQSDVFNFLSTWSPTNLLIFTDWMKTAWKDLTHPTNFFITHPTNFFITHPTNFFIIYATLL